MISRILILSLIVFSFSCDKRATKVMYMPDMVDVPSVKYLEDYIDPPQGSVPMHYTYHPSELEQAERELQNPLPLDNDNLAQGKKIFEIYCTVCHGSDGKGKGTLTEAYPPAPDITDPIYKDRKDGFYFYRITYGAALMPSYAHSISVQERWQVVHYLRQLQR